MTSATLPVPDADTRRSFHVYIPIVFIVSFWLLVASIKSVPTVCRVAYRTNWEGSPPASADLEQMIGERFVPVDHSTIYHGVQKYVPEVEKRLRWQWRHPHSTSWRVDETYVKVRGKWAHLSRTLDKLGHMAS